MGGGIFFTTSFFIVTSERSNCSGFRLVSLIVLSGFDVKVAVSLDAHLVRLARKSCWYSYSLYSVSFDDSIIPKTSRSLIIPDARASPDYAENSASVGPPDTLTSILAAFSRTLLYATCRAARATSAIDLRLLWKPIPLIYVSSGGPLGRR